MVQLKCQNRAAEIIIKPTSSALLIKELGKHDRDRKKVKNGIGFPSLSAHSQAQRQPHTRADQEGRQDDRGEVARQDLHRHREAGAWNSVTRKNIYGSNSLGATVDGKTVKEIIAKINAGELKVE